MSTSPYATPSTPPAASSKTTRASSDAAPELDAGTSAALVRRLLDPACYPHDAGRIELIETHISSVLLAGDYAYKIKKPLDLGFLDFHRLEQRREACEEEVRLNRRLAPDIYLGVVPITGAPDAPRVDGPGPAIEYAVRMRRFPPDATLDRLEADGGLDARQIDAIAVRVADFHLRACAHADAATPWGTPDAVWRPVEQNFTQLTRLLDAPTAQARLEELQRWSVAEHARLAPTMAERKRGGYVRECHGDLHLGNMAWVDDAPLIFDALEFNPALRWIDVQSEVAFCFMDLQQRGRGELAWRFLNGWLERTGDYAGVALLRYYLVYRALVRAKVHALRAAQSLAEHDAELATAHALLDFAAAWTTPGSARLDITHGLSGCGKTTVSAQLMQSPGAIRLRSDVERKRMAGLDAAARTQSGVAEGLYGPEATRATFDHLARLADGLLGAGWPVIVDATFLARWQRDLLRGVARAHGAVFRIVDFDVPADVLRTRIVQRLRAGTDASEADLAVLAHQIAQLDPLAADELAESVSYETVLLQNLKT